MSDTIPGYLTTDEAAAYLNTSVSTVQDWIRTKGLPYHKPGKDLRFRPRDLDAWMNRYRRGDKGLALMGFNDQLRRSR
jgi:excisionase family DNA binding protein